ncbi:MAG: hypothetical protein WBD81_03445 [Collimonas pratensis]|uniref:hypothetical protein n=1 Tax=Collimonas pratensis TaxID=279113 RepID=UPI003C715860
MKTTPPMHAAAAGEDWLAALLQQQAALDETADQGFSAVLMQQLPPQADAARRLAVALPCHAVASVLPAWLATALPWLGLYGLVVSAATMLWLALMQAQAVLPGAGWLLLFGSGMAESRQALVNLLATSLAPAVILGWLAWWLREQEGVLE